MARSVPTPIAEACYFFKDDVAAAEQLFGVPP
jgi:hypothetical protein